MTDIHATIPNDSIIIDQARGGSECLQLLSDRGADLSLGDHNGTTALHLAALGRKLSRVRLLIRAGADLCAKTTAGKSALHFVMKYTPSGLRTVEERMDGGLTAVAAVGLNDDGGEGHPGGHEYEGSAVKINFNLLLPSSRCARY